MCRRLSRGGREIMRAETVSRESAAQLWVLQPQCHPDEGDGPAGWEGCRQSQAALRHPQKVQQYKHAAARPESQKETLEQDRLLTARSESKSLCLFSFACVSGNSVSWFLARQDDQAAALLPDVRLKAELQVCNQDSAHSSRRFMHWRVHHCSRGQTSTTWHSWLPTWRLLTALGVSAKAYLT